VLIEAWGSNPALVSLVTADARGFVYLWDYTEHTRTAFGWFAPTTKYHFELGKQLLCPNTATTSSQSGGGGPDPASHDNVVYDHVVYDHEVKMSKKAKRQCRNDAELELAVVCNFLNLPESSFPTSFPVCYALSVKSRCCRFVSFLRCPLFGGVSVTT
jgi:hypothetical protein